VRLALFIVAFSSWVAFGLSSVSAKEHRSGREFQREHPCPSTRSNGKWRSSRGRKAQIPTTFDLKPFRSNERRYRIFIFA
jgi:hypothetical protein